MREYYRKELSMVDTPVLVWQSVSVAATGETSVNGNVFVPKTQETFASDGDFNCYCFENPRCLSQNSQSCVHGC